VRVYPLTCPESGNQSWEGLLVLCAPPRSVTFGRATAGPGCPTAMPAVGLGTQSRPPWADSGDVSSHRGVHVRAAYSRNACTSTQPSVVFSLTARTRAARWKGAGDAAHQVDAPGGQSSQYASAHAVAPPRTRPPVASPWSPPRGERGSSPDREGPRARRDERPRTSGGRSETNHERRIREPGSSPSSIRSRVLIPGNDSLPTNIRKSAIPKSSV